MSWFEKAMLVIFLVCLWVLTLVALEPESGDTVPIWLLVSIAFISGLSFVFTKGRR